MWLGARCVASGNLQKTGVRGWGKVSGTPTPSTNPPQVLLVKAAPTPGPSQRQQQRCGGSGRMLWMNGVMRVGEGAPVGVWLGFGCLAASGGLKRVSWGRL
ncbi:hypothetical protein E2C01_048473 [Portunus trituberculatus]|uniref:Uncharacterized protein n=1 Tax=Portunus trituberculatus TaxID=210409 RepID=A0A5B7G6I1_PORTR|nr:hypothetical protein [Portunus trituberculatus]